MHGTESTNANRSKIGDGISGIEVGKSGAETIAVKSGDISVGDEGNWFCRACRLLFPSKAGAALHFLTGFTERDCQRYAAGSVRPPAYFLRILLRSDHGWQFLCAVMDGSGVSWWSEVVRAKRIAAAVDREI